MKRLFNEHIKRITESLDGEWLFAIDPEDKGKASGWQVGFPDERRITVPSLWTAEPALASYEGVAWYRRDFYSDVGTVRIHFGAVMTYAEVWLDGEYLGSHYGGFCEFDFVKRIARKGKHILTVRVDNSFDGHSIPQAFVDWYHHGGIPRSVTLEHLAGITVVRNLLHYTVTPDLKAAEIRFDTELYNASDESLTTQVRISLDTLAFATPPITVAAGESTHVKTAAMRFDNIRLWSPDSPELYRLSTETDTDDLIDRVGFRKVEIEGGMLLLNGKSVELRGINRHEDHPDLGFALPEGLMMKDVSILKDLGANSVRGSHYPNARPFLDMLDSNGILFWSEIPIWGEGFSESAIADEKIVSRGLEMHKEMLLHYYNHPSIIIWGLHNEIRSDTDAAVKMTAAYYKTVKADGGNRIVTYATNHPLTDKCLDYCDVISVNDYHGWYNGDVAARKDFIASMLEYFDSLGHSAKPVILSEFGAAAVYGHRDFDEGIWSENYQAKLLSETLNLLRSNPRFIGYYIWHFADARTSREAGLTRARGYNNKGILNEYRKPKAAYYAVRDIYRAPRSTES